MEARQEKIQNHSGGVHLRMPFNLFDSLFFFFFKFQLHVSSDVLANNLRSLFFGLTVLLLTGLRLYSSSLSPQWFCTILPIKDVTT